MSLLNSIIKVFVGDKVAKDLKQIQPLVDAIKKFEIEITKLNHDELRQKTEAFKQKIISSY